MRASKCNFSVVSLIVVFIALCFASVVCAAGDMPSDLLEKVKNEGKKLNILNWGYYIAEDTIPNFEQEFGIKVIYDTFESADAMMAKIQAGGGGYDVVVADNEYVQYLIRLKSIQPLNHKWLPNKKNIMDRFVDPSYDPGNKYSVPYLWGSAGFVYNSKYTKGDPNLSGECSWAAILDSEKYAGRIGMLDSWGVSIAAALFSRGYSMNTHDKAQLMEAKKVLLAQKSRVKAYGEVRKLLEAEEVYLATLWSGDSVGVSKRNPAIKYCAPKEGMMIYLDNWTVLKGSERPATAHLWLNYLLRGKVAANNANYVHYATTNKAALPSIDEKDRNNPAVYPPGEVLKKCEFSEAFDGKQLELREEIWEIVKAH
jgi:spermidine/putrescine transport system substrate-binding protein